MRPRLRPVREQAIVITGATSGIGLATAYAAAGQGARVVMVARDGAALARVSADMRAQGAEVLTVAADVGKRAQVEAVADKAIAAFGGFDTWVNNAGVGIFGRLDQVSEADHRQLFETNYWGVVHGSLVAVQHLRLRGGVLVNMASILSEVSVPLQGAYCASKAAVRGFTEALRQELMNEGAPVRVSTVRPAAIDTPFPQHARNYTGAEPRLPPPLYAPEKVAAAVLQAAAQGGRDYLVGSAAPAIVAAGRLLPRLTDLASSLAAPSFQRRGRAATSPVEGNLSRSGFGGEMRGAPPPSPPVQPVPLGALAVLLATVAVSVLGGRRG